MLNHGASLASASQFTVIMTSRSVVSGRIKRSFTTIVLLFLSECLQVHNDRHCNSAPYTCQRSVSIFLPWEGELRLHATAVTFKGRRSVAKMPPTTHTHEAVPPHRGSIALHAALAVSVSSLQLPHRIHDLQLEQISQYVLVTRQQGFTLAWEGGAGSVYIKLSPEFVGATCGMCGNFNADVQDDLRTSYGKTTGDDIIDGLIDV